MFNLAIKLYWWGTKHNHKSNNYEEEKSNDNKVMSSDRLGEIEADQIEINPEYFEEVPEFLKQKEEESRLIQVSHLKKEIRQRIYGNQ